MNRKNKKRHLQKNRGNSKKSFAGPAPCSPPIPRLFHSHAKHSSRIFKNEKKHGRQRIERWTVLPAPRAGSARGYQ